MSLNVIEFLGPRLTNDDFYPGNKKKSTIVQTVWRDDQMAEVKMLCTYVTLHQIQKMLICTWHCCSMFDVNLIFPDFVLNI